MENWKTSSLFWEQWKDWKLISFMSLSLLSNPFSSSYPAINSASLYDTVRDKSTLKAYKKLNSYNFHLQNE